MRLRKGRIELTGFWGDFMREAFNGREEITTQGGKVAAVYVDEEDTEQDNDSDSELDAIDHTV